MKSIQTLLEVVNFFLSHEEEEKEGSNNLHVDNVGQLLRSCKELWRDGLFLTMIARLARDCPISLTHNNNNNNNSGGWFVPVTLQ